MAESVDVRRWAEELIKHHLDPKWSFEFDNAKTRAGLCNYTVKKITVSRYLAARYDDDEIQQVLLHEVAHALAGSRAGHGPKWRVVAASLGYEGTRLHDGAIAHELAPWVGVCPGGHAHYRYRQPSRALACGRCSRRFDANYVIVWTKRLVHAPEQALATG